MLYITWTGAAGLQLQNGEDFLLIDPYYTRIGILHTLLRPIVSDEAAVAAALPDMARVDAVVVGHTHSDHVLDVPHIAAHSRAKVVGSRSLATLMRISGLPDRSEVCRGGETLALTEHASVTMIPSIHGNVAMGKVPLMGEILEGSQLPMKAGGYRVGDVFAPKLTMNGTTLLHNGSANFIDDAVAGHTCDVLFLCVPGWKKRRGYPEDLIDLTQPDTVVLFHYDNFSKPHIKGGKTRMFPGMDLNGLEKRVRACAPRVRIIIPEVGETMSF